MKIAILSDFHLGYERFRDDAFKQAEEALQKASESADALLIPGDIFDMRAPKPEVLAEAINLFRHISRRKWSAEAEVLSGEAAHTKVPIIAIPGTHERRAQDAEDPVDLLHLAGLLIDISDSTVMITKGNEKVAVRGLGGIAEERFRDVLNAAAPKPTNGAFNILMFHQSIYELLPFNASFIKLAELPKGFDLYVNGHIHNRIELDIHGKKMLIPGSTVLTQLKEAEQEGKGFFIFDTSTGSYEFISIKSRRFLIKHLEIDGNEPAAIFRAAERCIEDAIGTSNDLPIIRVVLDGNVKRGFKKSDINVQELTKLYTGKAIVEIANKGSEELQISGAQESTLMDNISIRDYGLSIFLGKLKESGYSATISPVELFDILSVEGAKEKNVKRAIEVLLADKTNN